MPKKKSVKRCAKQFREDADVLLNFCETAERGLSDAHVSMVYDAAVIKLYASFERMILGTLTGAINNDTSHISAKTNVEFPQHLKDEVCEYIVTGGRYFDFRGRSGLIDKIKDYVPDDHYLVRAIKDQAHTESLNQLCALRNYAAHGSKASKKAALDSVGQTRIGTAGSWLKAQNRFQKLVTNLSELSARIEADAPY